MATADHPIAGVISLLEKLEVETKQEAAAEAESFQKYQYWCKRSTRRLARAMKKEKKLIAELATKIEGLTADIETLGEDIAALEAQLEVLDQQKQRARAMRGEEHVHYMDALENLDDSIKASDKAIEVMKEKGEAGLSTSRASNLLLMVRHVIETFMKLEDKWASDKLAEDQGETNAYHAYTLAKQARDTAISTAEASKSEK